MKIKGIIYQNKPKKIHGSFNRIELRLLQHEYIYEREEKK